MRNKLTICAAALTSVSLLPIAAHAQYDTSDIAATSNQSSATVATSKPLDQVDFGFQYVGGHNTYLYGRYNGFTEQGLDLVGDFIFRDRDAWDSGSTWFYDVEGTDISLQTGDRLAKGFHDSGYVDSTTNNIGPMADVSVKFGEQGTWKISLGYDAISYTGNIIDSIYTMNGATGTLNNGLLPYGGATNIPMVKGATTAFTTTTLSPAEAPVAVGTRRDILQGGGQYILDDWTVNVNIRHEHKEGSLEESLRETYGGQAFAMPIDFDTDRFDVSAAYDTPDMQAIFQYTFASFRNSNIGVVLPYPVSQASLSATSGPYAQSGLYSEPPSTSAHYLTGMFGDNFAPGTRLTVSARVGVELQDSTFPANSADPGLSSSLGSPAHNWFGNLNSLNQGTSAASPDDVAWVYHGTATLTSQLDSDIDGRVAYSFDGRNVHLNQFMVWTGGSSPDATATTAVYVVPQDWFKQTATIEGTYHVDRASDTKLTVSYVFNDTERTNAQVDHSVTNTESAELVSELAPNLLGRLGYEHSQRSGELVYGRAWGNLENGVPEIYDTPSGAYYQAPMTSNTVTFRLDYAPSGKISGGIVLKYVDENYNYPAVPNTAPSGDWTLVGHGEGIKEDYNLTVGPDVSYKPTKQIDLHAYYTYEKIYFNNLGNGACAESATGTCLGSAGYFQNTYDSNMNTAGFSGDWQVDDKLKLSLEYNMSSGSIAFGEFNGVEVASVSQSYQNVSPYPNINSLMHQIRVSAAFQIADNVECSFNYQFAMFHNNDWNDFTAPVQATTNTGTAISILTPGYPPPSFNVSAIGVAFKVTL